MNPFKTITIKQFLKGIKLIPKRYTNSFKQINFEVKKKIHFEINTCKEKADNTTTPCYLMNGLIEMVLTEAIKTAGLILYISWELIVN